MLKFDRPEFRSGVMIVKELVSQEPNVFVNHRFYVRDKGKTFEFTNPSYMLSKYPHLFTAV